MAGPIPSDCPFGAPRFTDGGPDGRRGEGVRRAYLEDTASAPFQLDRRRGTRSWELWEFCEKREDGRMGLDDHDQMVGTNEKGTPHESSWHWTLIHGTIFKTAPPRSTSWARPPNQTSRLPCSSDAPSHELPSARCCFGCRCSVLFDTPKKACWCRFVLSWYSWVTPLSPKNDAFTVVQLVHVGTNWLRGTWQFVPPGPSLSSFTASLSTKTPGLHYRCCRALVGLWRRRHRALHLGPDGRRAPWSAQRRGIRIQRETKQRRRITSSSANEQRSNCGHRRRDTNKSSNIGTSQFSLSKNCCINGPCKKVKLLACQAGTQCQKHKWRVRLRAFSNCQCSLRPGRTSPFKLHTPCKELGPLGVSMSSSKGIGGVSLCGFEARKADTARPIEDCRAQPTKSKEAHPKQLTQPISARNS